jgi:hypothetical protein
VKLANLILLPGKFQITAPEELVLLTTNIVKNISLDNEQIKQEVEELWSHWYVVCSISGDKIPLNMLKYWNPITQEVYAKPELVRIQNEYTR